MLDNLGRVEQELQRGSGDKKYHVARYYLEALAAFEAARREGADMLNQYAARLQKANQDLQLLNLTMHSKSEMKIDLFARIKWFFLGIIFYLTSIGSFIGRIPMYTVQKRKMNFSRLDKLGFKKAIITMASNRLYSTSQVERPRDYLKLLISNTFDKSVSNEMLAEIPNAKYIYIFDPSPTSRFWKHNQVFWNNRIFIIDTQFLIFIFMVNIIKSLPRLIHGSILKFNIYREIKSPFKFSFKTFKNVLAAAFVIECYNEVIDHRYPINALFLTSNSFTTELLRIFLIEHQLCTDLCEILHGVPTKEFERYFSKLMELSILFANPKKHSFIFQVPQLPHYGIFKVHDNSKNDGINTYINKYIGELQAANWGLEEYVKSQHQYIFPMQPAHVNDHIITIMGASSHDPDYFMSNAFKLECFVIKQIKKVMEESNKHYSILYTPHPRFSVEDFKNHPFFSMEKIIVYTNTIFTWFISDMSFALYSSALFESSYFGIQSFTPVICDDNIYPTELLNLLFNPDDKNNSCNIKDALIKFIYAGIEKPARSISEKITERMELLYKK